MTEHDRRLMIKNPADTPTSGRPHAKWARAYFREPVWAGTQLVYDAVASSPLG
jgi:hypothetical protein